MKQEKAKVQTIKTETKRIAVQFKYGIKPNTSNWRRRPKESNVGLVKASVNLANKDVLPRTSITFPREGTTVAMTLEELREFYAAIGELLNLI